MTVPDEREALGPEIKKRLEHGLSPQTFGKLIPQPSDLGTSVVGRCLRGGYRPLNEEEIAEFHRTNRRAILRAVKKAGWNDVRSLEGISRLVHVVRLLAESDPSVARVAELLAFPSEREVRRLVDRTTGLTVRKLRELGPMDVLASRTAFRGNPQ
jgi:hypothetical protein